MAGLKMPKIVGPTELNGTTVPAEEKAGTKTVAVPSDSGDAPSTGKKKK